MDAQTVGGATKESGAEQERIGKDRKGQYETDRKRLKQAMKEKRGQRHRGCVR